MPKILELERRLGFKWERGISMTKSESRQVPALRDLLKDIKELMEDFGQGTSKPLRRSRPFRTRCEDLVVRYADQLWPMEPVDTSGWLVDARFNTWDGLYPKNLAYRNIEDQDILCSNFHALLFEKCMSYRKRLLQKKPYDDDDASVSQSEAEESEDKEDDQDERKDDLRSVSGDEVGVSQTTPGASPNAPCCACIKCIAARSSAHNVQQQSGTSSSAGVSLPPVAHMLPINDGALFANNGKANEAHINETDITHPVRRTSLGRTIHLPTITIADATNRARLHGASLPDPTTQPQNSSVSIMRKRANPAVSESGVSLESEANKKRVSHSQRKRSKIVVLKLTSDKLKMLSPADEHIIDTRMSQPSPARPPVDEQETIAHPKQQIKVHQPKLEDISTTSAAADNPISTPRYPTNNDDTITINPSTTAQHATPIVSQPLTHTPSKPIIGRTGDEAGQRPKTNDITLEQLVAQSTNSDPQSRKSSLKACATNRFSVNSSFEQTVLGSGLSGVAAMTLRFDPVIPNIIALQVAMRASGQQLDKLSNDVSVLCVNEHSGLPCVKQQVTQPEEISHTQEQAAEVLTVAETQSRRLAVQLRSTTTEPNPQQFLIISIDTSVEQLFLKIQRRMNRRLEGKEIQLVNLYLPGQEDALSAYRVEKDDPDTWEVFVDLLKEQSKEGEKLKVVADVEV